MDITACPKCGSKHIYTGNISDGVLTGYTSRYVCQQCGYQGMPIVFDNETDYQKFFKNKKPIAKKPKKKKKVI